LVDLWTYLVLALSLLSFGSWLSLLWYLPLIRRIAASYRESSAIVTHILDELDSRASFQDRKVADIGVRLDVLEERWLRVGWTSGPPSHQPLTDEYVRQAERAAVEYYRKPPTLRSEAAPRPSATTGKDLRLTRAEVAVLKSLVDRTLTAPEARGVLGSSREHAARIMKSLADKGLVVRSLAERPYVYELSDDGRGVITGRMRGEP
jgi:hypothetical protein